MEEIDIIELLQRVKEGKAPKKIEILGNCYIRNTDEDKDILDYMYKGNIDYWTCETQVDIDTKIKILDKPKIEEMKIHKNDNDNPILIKKDGKTNNLRTIDVEIINKTNEIIKWINKENKDE